MRGLVFICALALVSAFPNEDELRDQLVRSRPIRAATAGSQVVCPPGYKLGGVVTAGASGSSIKSVANKFAGVLGRRAASSLNCIPIRQDACIYGSGIIKPINPWGPTNPIKLPTGGGSISTHLGKRAVDPNQFKKPNRDIVFVLDTSGSVPMDAFERAKESIAILNKAFCPTKFGAETDGRKQVALVLFGNKVETEIPFAQSHNGITQLNGKIIATRHREGYATATAEALRHVRLNILGKPGSRLYDNDTSTIVIVITDGRCNRGCQTLESEAKKLRNLGPGVQLFAMGVANARACELEIISGKGSSLAYGLSDFNQLEAFAKAVNEKAKTVEDKCV